MVKQCSSVSSISYFLCYAFISSFFVKALVSQPIPRPDQLETLLAFKNEFPNFECNFIEWPNSKPVTKSWTNKNVSSFEGVVFDNKTGVVTKLDLHGACLSGILISNSSLFKLQHLTYLDLSHNHFDSSSFLAELGKLANLEVLVLASMGLVGEIPMSLCNQIDLCHYTAIDFSGNKLGGQIPESVGLLKSLMALNLSNNDFNGPIPSSLAKLKNLESLDLSRNQLSGKIPQELGKLSYLAYMNVSHNKLSGQIPQGTQFQTYLGSAFEGNIDLCGLPLQKICSKAKGTPSPQRHVLNSKAIRNHRLTLTTFGLGIVHVMWFVNLF